MDLCALSNRPESRILTRAAVRILLSQEVGFSHSRDDRIKATRPKFQVWLKSRDRAVLSPWVHRSRQELIWARGSRKDLVVREGSGPLLLSAQIIIISTSVRVSVVDMILNCQLSIVNKNLEVTADLILPFMFM